jgi:hypothetical protein
MFFGTNQRRTAASAYAASNLLALTALPVAVAIEPVRVGRQDREVAPIDVIAVQIWRRRRDTEVRIGAVAVTRRPGRGRPGPAGSGRRRPRPPSRRRRPGRLRCRRLHRGGRRLSRAGRRGHQRRHDRGYCHGADRLLLLPDARHEGAEQEADHPEHPTLTPPRWPAAWRLTCWSCAPAPWRLLSPAATGRRDRFGRPVHLHPRSFHAAERAYTPMERSRPRLVTRAPQDGLVLGTIPSSS